MIRITREDFDLKDVISAVKSPRAGAVVTFLGTVRGLSDGGRVELLHYESYRSMAEKELLQITEEAGRRFDIIEAAIVHRTGRLNVGENIVAIAVSAVHRDAAFKACRFIIDELKARAAIWKKEFTVRGESWVKGKT
ncbi:MAG: molybdenum cofactor biosynthesis protein MoaE [Aigarchaeota archaeon]|nr:molybdenum cofactor biosynthesis protein MoaE [Aigarchaeota archaeon]